MAGGSAAACSKPRDALFLSGQHPQNETPFPLHLTQRGGAPLAPPLPHSSPCPTPLQSTPCPPLPHPLPHPTAEHPFPGQRWKEVRHDKTVTWLAFWKDPINTKEFKYVFLAANSTWKSESDLQK